MKYIFILFFSFAILFSISAQAQEPTMPYHEIESYPNDFAPGNIMARFIDGLGYRYYWATKGLKVTDLDYRPSDEARNTMETIEHIYDLSASIMVIAEGKPNKTASPRPYESYEDLRNHTLINLQTASEAFANKTESELTEMSIRKSDDGDAVGFPLWHLMNGQIADAIYHTGQIASFRRTTGNPVDKNVSVFMGKNR